MMHQRLPVKLQPTNFQYLVKFKQTPSIMIVQILHYATYLAGNIMAGIDLF